MKEYAEACREFFAVAESLPKGRREIVSLGVYPGNTHVISYENGKTFLSYENGDADGRIKTLELNSRTKNCMINREGDFHSLTEEDLNKAVASLGFRKRL